MMALYDGDNTLIRYRVSEIVDAAYSAFTALVRTVSSLPHSGVQFDFAVVDDKLSKQMLMVWMMQAWRTGPSLMILQ